MRRATDKAFLLDLPSVNSRNIKNDTFQKAPKVTVFHFRWGHFKWIVKYTIQQRSSHHLSSLQSITVSIVLMLMTWNDWWWSCFNTFGSFHRWSPSYLLTSQIALSSATSRHLNLHLSVLFLYFFPYTAESYFNMAEKNRPFPNKDGVRLHSLFRL